MPNLADANAKLLSGWLPDHSDRKIMYAGRYDAITGQPDPNVYNGVPEGFLWVHDSGSRVAVPALMSALTALCFVGFGDRLRTGINEEGDREAIAPYIIRQNANKLNQILYESKKALPTPVDSIEGGIVRAPATPSLKLYVGADASQGWLGGEIDVDAGDEPANPNELRFLIVHFTGIYGEAPTYVPTTAHVAADVDSFTTTYLAEAYAALLPNQAIRLWAVTYAEGQSTFTYTESRFTQLRQVINPDWLVTVDTSSASDGDVPTWDVTAEEFVAAAQTGGSSGSYAYLLLREQQTQNTDGGTFTSGAPRTRVLNTEVTDSGGHCALASNQFTLAAGTYDIDASAPAFGTNRHQAWLYNISDSAVTILGTSEFASSLTVVSPPQTRSVIKGRFTIASTKTFEIQHQAETTSNTVGLGVAANITTEVYTVVELRKVS